MASRAGGDAIKLVTADTAGALTSSGHLLFVRGGTLYAQPLDQRRLVISGEPAACRRVSRLPARKGRLCRFGDRLDRLPCWQPTEGSAGLAGPCRHQTRMALEPDPTGLFNPAVSADGRVLLQRNADGNDIWLVGGPAVGATRATDDSANEWCPVWSSRRTALRLHVESDGRVRFCSAVHRPRRRRSCSSAQRPEDSDMTGPEMVDSSFIACSGIRGPTCGSCPSGAPRRRWRSPTRASMSGKASSHPMAGGWRTSRTNRAGSKST